MQGIMYDHIQSLDKSRTNWRLKVRCTRAWQTVSNDNNVVKGHNFVFLDDDNSHVHAYVYPDNWSAINKEVVEGKIYVVQNFQVRDSIGKLKPVSNKICIRLLSSTIIELQPDDVLIPFNKFEFMDIGDLHEEIKKSISNGNPEFTVDIIGAIEKFHKSKKIPTKIGERDVVRFIITDGSISHNVTVWGEFASAVSSDYYKTELEQPVIGIIASSKIGMFREFVQIGTLPSTRIYFNLDVEPVNELRNRLKEEGYNPSRGFALAVNDIVPVLEHVSFASLIGNADSILDKVSVLVTFIVKKIEEADNWWFHSCTVCHEEVVKVERKFKCEACNRSFPYSEKRFRILVLAEDATHACNVILMDRIVKRIFGTTATNMLNEMKKTPADNPINEMYKMIVGKEICAKIVLTQGNKSGDSNLYEAVDLFDQKFHDAGHGDKSPGSSVASFNQSSVVHGIELFQTPGSSGSVSKKIKKEEDVDVVHVE